MLCSEAFLEQRSPIKFRYSPLNRLVRWDGKSSFTDRDGNFTMECGYGRSLWSKIEIVDCDVDQLLSFCSQNAASGLSPGSLRNQRARALLLPVT